MTNLNTLFTGKVLHAFEELDSTNDFAHQLLAKTAPTEGTAISAAFQRAGKGQIGSSWQSERGKNLLLSVIYHPSFLLPARQFSLTQAAALAVSDAVSEALQEPILVKWPNDIYAGHRKIAGILIQNTLQGKLIRHSVFGIGLNVNQTDFPAELPNPTSMFLESSKTFQLEAVRNAVLEKMEQWYLRLRAGQTAALETAYRSRLYLLDKPWQFSSPERGVFEGIIRGVNDSGRLQIESDKKLLSFGFKEVAFCRRDGMNF